MKQHNEIFPGLKREKRSYTEIGNDILYWDRDIEKEVVAKIYDVNSDGTYVVIDARGELFTVCEANAHHNAGEYAYTTMFARFNTFYQERKM